MVNPMALSLLLSPLGFGKHHSSRPRESEGRSGQIVFVVFDAVMLMVAAF
jgi:hypothetical protein